MRAIRYRQLNGEIRKRLGAARVARSVFKHELITDYPETKQRREKPNEKRTAPNKAAGGAENGSMASHTNPNKKQACGGLWRLRRVINYRQASRFVGSVVLLAFAFVGALDFFAPLGYNVSFIISAAVVFLLIDAANRRI